MTQNADESRPHPPSDPPPPLLDEASRTEDPHPPVDVGLHHPLSDAPHPLADEVGRVGLSDASPPPGDEDAPHPPSDPLPSRMEDDARVRLGDAAAASRDDAHPPPGDSVHAGLDEGAHHPPGDSVLSAGDEATRFVRDDAAHPSVEEMLPMDIGPRATPDGAAHPSSPAVPDAPPAQAPMERMDPKVILVWRIGAGLGWLVTTTLATILLLLLEWSPAWSLLVAAAGVAYTVRVPPNRHRHFGFRVGERDVRVQRGWLWRSESVVLHSRIQHVDTRQGPIERTMGLATVVLFTAGSVGAMVAIPGLRAERAEALRDRLVRLSGTDDAV
jgi:membrane protein YdbS with pleckstrin-like domain